MGKRMNIALCVGMIENAFTNSIIDGAMLGAKDIDANLFILPVGIIDAQYDNVGANCYRYQYNTLTSVIHAKSFDAVVLEYGTVTSFLDEEQKSEFLRQFDGIPIMLVAGEREGYSSVCVDNKTGLEEVISYLIEEKSCTRIGFVLQVRMRMNDWKYFVIRYANTIWIYLMTMWYMGIFLNFRKG